MKTIFNKEKREELAKLAKEMNISLKEMICNIRNEERKSKRQSRQSNQQKLALYRKHHLDADKELVKKHETAEVRFEQTINEKILALNQFAKRTNLSKEDKEYVAAKKKIESHNMREKMIAERKADRKARKENAAIRTTEQGKLAIEHFLKSEAKRKAKQEEKRSKYAGKKKKVAPRPFEAQTNSSTSSEMKKYYIVSEWFNKDHSEQFDNEPVVIHCSSTKLHKRLAEFHNKNMEKDAVNYVGTYVYNEETCNHCILESINSQYYTINGYLTSRLAAQREVAAAA